MTVPVSATALTSTQKEFSGEQTSLGTLGINARFAVVLDGDINLGYWKSCKGLAVQFISKELYEGGSYDSPAAILPDTMKYPPIILERAISENDSPVVQKWLSEMSQKWMSNRYCNYGGSTAAVSVQDSALNTLITWNLRGVYPSRWTGPDLDAMSSGGVAMERLELVHMGFL
ncbi:phage tail protein [Streptomyces sp. NPDC055085]